MIKALITILVVVVVGLGAWQLFEYWDKIQNEKVQDEKAAAAKVVNPDALTGVPYELLGSLQAAEKGGPSALGNWLKLYGNNIQDPRKAWIQLDYIVMITRDNPQEAKQIFSEVKDRTQPNSQVWPRVQGMEKTYE